MGIRRLPVSWSLITANLHMPDDVELAGVELDKWGTGVEFTIYHPDFPDVIEGNEIPIVNPIIHYHAERWEWDWNPEEEEKKDG